MSDFIRITHSDLADPKVDEAIEREQALKMLAERAQVGFVRRFLFSSVLYTAIVGMIGGCLGWAILEPMYGETAEISGTVQNWNPDFVAVLCRKCNTLNAGEQGWKKGQACASCKEALELPEEHLYRGRLQLEKTNIYLIEGATRIEHNGKVLLAGDPQAAGLFKKDTRIRAVVRIVEVEGNAAGARYPAPAIRITVVSPDDAANQPDETDLAAIAKRNSTVGWFIFALVGGMIALMIGAVEGIVSMNPRQMFFAGVIGFGIGFAGGFAGMLPARLFYFASSLLTQSIAAGGNVMQGGPFFAQIVGRSIAWGLVGMALALGQGVARKSSKMALHGVIGGCIGGLFGGMLFDPIGKLFESDSGDLSRGVAFSVLGLMIGLFTGIVEQLSKEAWLLMRAGPLAGKQFVVYKSPTLIGSSQHCEIYLFKDALVADEHARLTRVGREFEIEDLNNPSRTTVNGNPVQKCILRDGDSIVIGQTELEYRSRGS